METIKREIKITAKYIPLLAEFMAKQDIRYYLNALQVEPHPEGGILLITTDGHTMAIVHDKDGTTNGEWLCELPPKIIRACAKPGSRNDLFSKPKHLHFVGNVAHVMSQDGDPNEIGLMHLETAFCKIVDGKYPDWRKVMPKKPKGLKRTCVNINYLARLQRISKFSETRYAEGVHLFQEDLRGVIVARPVELPEVMVLVMPMHDDKNAPAIPDWLPLKSEQQRKAA
jgi:DNA polymerase III sliding clamp (beta) subunit (PCNA family)